MLGTRGRRPLPRAPPPRPSSLGVCAERADRLTQHLRILNPALPPRDPTEEAPGSLRGHSGTRSPPSSTCFSLHRRCFPEHPQTLEAPTAPRPRARSDQFLFPFHCFFQRVSSSMPRDRSSSLCFLPPWEMYSRGALTDHPVSPRTVTTGAYRGPDPACLVGDGTHSPASRC